MLTQSILVALAASVSTVSAAAAQGFNYGSTDSSGAAIDQAGFEQLFKTAQNLVGTKGFSSARLYTMIQAGTTEGVISAIPAAIDTKTGLLLGMWASAGESAFKSELAALESAISLHGPQLASLVEGISVGSEDLYRETPTAVENHAGVGAGPDTLVSYIQQVRSVIKGTVLENTKIGHVDTWTAWANSSNSAVIDNIDWLGLDEYPYFENTHPNAISDAKADYDDAYGATKGAAQGKPIWITETAWPVSGPNFGEAVANTANAETYWKQVVCPLIGTTNLYYYTLFDAPSSPSFGIVTSPSDTTPLFDLSCDGSETGTGTGTGTETDKPGPNEVTSTYWSTITAETCTEGQDFTVTIIPTVYETVECSECSAPKPTEMPAPMPTETGKPGPGPGKECPGYLSKDYQYPHLMVGVDSSEADKAFGTSYDAEISSTVSTIYNFDIPESYAGKTCNLVFLFPEKSQLETSDYTYSSTGGIEVNTLVSPADKSTTFNNRPASSGETGTIASLETDSAHTIKSGPCEAGKTVSYELSALNGLDLKYFEDYNPCPLGLFITTS